MQLILILALAGVLLFGAALGALCYAEVNPPPVSAESGAVIVLGCQVYSTGRLSPQLELRLQAALDTYRAHPRLIICCGGQGEKEPAPEGQVMRDWLVAQGGTSVLTEVPEMPRALALARDVGLAADGIGSPCRPEIGFWVKNHAREVLAWGKYLVQKILPGQ